MEEVNENMIMTKMQEADDTNSRYVLELERTALLEQKAEFDQKYGTITFSFLTSIEFLALLAYISITVIIFRRQSIRSKTGMMVAIWSSLNVIVLLAKIYRQVFVMLESSGYPKLFLQLEEMLGGLSRIYGTCLYIVWWYNRYHTKINPKYNWFLYFLMAIPSLVFLSFIYIYLVIDPYVHEVFTPGCDVVSVAIYLFVTIMFIYCQIINDECYSHSHYVLLLSIVNFVINFPVSLTFIYIRFALDISWVYRFHIYFVDFILDVILSTNAFIALFIVILCKDKVKKNMNYYM